MRYNRHFPNNDFVPDTDYTLRLSQYLADLKYEDIPANVIERAKFILLQTVGVSLAARGTDVVKKADAIAVAGNGGLGGAVTRWIEGGKLSAVNAAFLAGTAADALDWEDCSWTGHPAAGIIPAAIIAAEEKKKSGKELVTAIVGAYEVYQRIANAIQPGKERIKIGWGLTSWQIFGVVAAAAKLYDFDARKIDQALSVASEHASIPACYHETTMSDFYHYEHGFRAKDGLIIVKQIEKGIHNQRGAFDFPQGFIAAMTEEPKPEWFTKELGTRYLILETLLKHWPANMWVQSPLEAVAAIVEKNDVRKEDITEIIVEPGVGDRMWAPKEGFSSVTHAQFSVPYVIAAYLLEPEPGAHWYRKENLTNPKLIELSQKVKSGPSEPDYPDYGFALFREGKYPLKTVTVKTGDGKTYVEQVDRHLGHPGNMFSREEISNRFILQASPVLSENKAKEAVEAIFEIETVEDVTKLETYLHA